MGNSYEFPILFSTIFLQIFARSPMVFSVNFFSTEKKNKQLMTGWLEYCGWWYFIIKLFHKQYGKFTVSHFYFIHKVMKINEFYAIYTRKIARKKVKLKTHNNGLLLGIKIIAESNEFYAFIWKTCIIRLFLCILSPLWHYILYAK